MKLGQLEKKLKIDLFLNFDFFSCIVSQST